MARISERDKPTEANKQKYLEEKFRKLANFCLRCGLFPRLQDRNICEYCTADDHARLLTKRIARKQARCAAA